MTLQNNYMPYFSFHKKKKKHEKGWSYIFGDWRRKATFIIFALNFYIIYLPFKRNSIFFTQYDKGHSQKSKNYLYAYGKSCINLCFLL